jgi:polar amino acid transport system substrate-binding protein
MNKSLPLLIAIFVLVFSGTGMADDRIKLGYIEFPPYTSTSDSGVPEGILIDLAAKVFPKAGYDWYAVSYPVMRLADYLVNGELDVWMGLKTLPQFENRAYIGETIVAELILNSYTRGDKPLITTKEDLSGKTVIVMRGYSYGGWINYIAAPENNVGYIKTNKHTAAFNMLKAGRADYVLDYKDPSDMALKEVYIADLKVQRISSLPCFFIVSGKMPNGQEVLKRLEKAHSELQQAGEL